MNLAIHTLLAFTVTAGSLLAQAPNQPSKPASPPPPITAKDVRIFPFARELQQTSLDGKRGQADELRVATTTNKVHLSGRKRVDSVKVDGRLICHSGKLALLAPADRGGKLAVRVPTADDVTYYFASIELTDGTLSTKPIKLETRKTYEWSFKTEAGQSTFRIVDGQTELAAISAPSEKVKGYGFAATVRWKNNEADLEFTIQ